MGIAPFVHESEHVLSLGPRPRETFLRFGATGRMVESTQWGIWSGLLQRSGRFGQLPRKEQGTIAEWRVADECGGKQGRGWRFGPVRSAAAWDDVHRRLRKVPLRCRLPLLHSLRAAKEEATVATRPQPLRLPTCSAQAD